MYCKKHTIDFEVEPILSIVFNELTRHGFQVIMGGGRQEFLPKTMNGNREDGRDMITEWKMQMMKTHKRYDYVKNKTELSNLNLKNVDKLLGNRPKSHFNTYELYCSFAKILV